MAMMKAALAASLLVALVALASATSYTTTVTTTSMDEDTNRSYQQCSQQVQGRQFRACQRYLQQRSSGPYNAGDEEEDEEVAGNPQQQYLQECCQQLKEMDRQQCGCEAIRHAVREAQHGQGGRSYHTGQSEQIYQRARALPRRCRLTHQQCRFSVVFV